MFSFPFLFKVLQIFKISVYVIGFIYSVNIHLHVPVTYPFLLFSIPSCIYELPSVLLLLHLEDDPFITCILLWSSWWHSLFVFFFNVFISHLFLKDTFYGHRILVCHLFSFHGFRITYQHPLASVVYIDKPIGILIASLKANEVPFPLAFF